MDLGPFDLEANLWAARIVAGYASQARPEMSDGARAVMLDHLTRALTPAIASTPVGDWPEAANAALDTWEDEARTAGPRVQAFDEAAGVVRFRVAG